MLKDMANRFGFGKVSVIHGGLTRHQSIHLGLKSLQHSKLDQKAKSKGQSFDYYL